MEAFRQREAFVRFANYTGGMDLFPFLYYNYGLKEFFFDCSKWLNWCECHGIEEEESVEEFNIRNFQKGKRLNKLILEMIEYDNLRLH